jgi:16S rRNA (guanine527-N7)-methyltransferase
MILDDFGISSSTEGTLSTYMDILWEANKDLNLFSRNLNCTDLIHLHLYDSLLGSPHLPEANSIADLGTGGGFPAIPMAICNPDKEFTLIEKSPKKAFFLDSLKWLVPNIRIVCSLVPEGIHERTQLVIARAFKPLPIILELTEDYLARGGSYLLWKGRREVIDGEIVESGKILKKHKSQVNILPLIHPTRDVERHLIIINPGEKTKPC